ncbi:T9SS type A sorting domain-containing protein [Ferruginibacter lapsinanis]|uniref:T9SS type A sorting domain-containing protein n=1 Tax=Ferruginibacter lapsinanis TaxID=563172 RepID=UPI001E29930C|nr:T9SS type A sorting domain-containing protein [Ferruginibacter lapsinanis]UEG49488.1 T9SS type A sorting domain-containing protein [Ferruginibacter lapsinanis]
MKRNIRILFMLFLLEIFAMVAIAQPANVEGNWRTGSWVNNMGTFSARRGSTLMFRAQKTGGSSKQVLFNTAAGNYSPKWTASSGTDYTKNSRITNGAVYNGGSDIYFASTTNNYYTFVIGSNNSSSNDFSILETTYNPTTFSSAPTQSPTSGSVVAGNNVTVTVSLSADPQSGEYAYVRYSSDNFASDYNVVQVTGFSSGVGTATIPAAFNTAGKTVSYYVFTSNSSSPAAANADYLALRVQTQSGENGSIWSYTVASATPAAVTLSGISTIAAANIATASTSNIIYNFQLAVTTSSTQLTQVVIPTASGSDNTYASGDLTNLKLWYSATSSSFGTASVISTIASPANATSQTFGSLSQTINSGSTGYFWVTADVQSGATIGNTITVTSALAFSNLTFAVAPTQTVGTINPGGRQTIVAATPAVTLSEISTVGAANILATTTNNIIYNFKLAVTAAGTTLTAVTFPNSGSYNGSDFTNFKLYYTTSSTFATTNLLSTISTPSNTSPQTFSGLSQALTAGNTGYFWITADVASGATVNHTITVTPALAFSNLTFSTAISSTVGTINAGGQQTIAAAPAWSITDFYVYVGSVGYYKNGSGGQGSTTFNGANVSTNNFFMNDVRLYTTRNNAQSICSGTMYYSIYPSASSPSTWGTVSLTSGGTGGTGPTTGGSSPQAQALGATSLNLNVLCGLATGTYKIAIYFTFSGNPSASSCPGTTDVYTDNNSGNYYILSFTNTNSSTVTAVSGTAVTTCSTSGAVNITAGSSATNYSSIVWTSSGTGTFANANSLTTCTYTPSAADISAGSVTITLSSTGNGTCTSTTVTSSKTLTINVAPVISTHPTGTQSLCQGSGTTSLSVATSSGTNLSYQWYSNTSSSNSGGTGLGSSNGAQTATYTPVSTTAGTLYYYVVISNSGCTSATSNVSGAVTVKATGTWLGGAPGYVDEWNNASNWCGGIPTSTTDVVIPSGVTYFPKIQSANALAKTISISSGASLTMTGAYNLSIYGSTFSNSGSFSASASTGSVRFLAYCTISGTTTFNNVDYYGGLNFGTSSSISGNLTVQTGAYTDINGPTYLTGSTLIYNTGAGGYDRRVEWSTASGNSYPYNVLITGNSKVYSSSASALAANTPMNIAGDLTIDNGSQLFMDDFNSHNNMTVSLIIGGSMNLKGSLSASLTSGADIRVTKDWNFTVGGNFYPNSRAVRFIGSTLQTIKRSAAGTLNFDYVLIQNTSGGVQLYSGTNINFNSGGDCFQMLGTGTGNVFDLNGNTATITNGGNLKISGTPIITSSSAANFNISAGGGNVNGSTGVEFGANVTVGLNSDFNFGSSLSTIKGILSINSGGSVSTNPPIYYTNSVLLYNSGGTYNRYLEWSTTSGAGYPYHVTIQNGTSLDLSANGGTATARSCAGNLNLGTTSSAGSLTMGAMSVILTVGGDANIGSTTGTSTLTLGSVSGGDIYVGGSWTRSSNGSFVHNDREVVFNGATTPVTLTASGGEDFAYVELNKTAIDKTLTLASHVRVATRVKFTRGTLDLATNGKYFTLLSTATKTAQVGVSSSANTAFNLGSGQTGQFIIQRYVPAKRAWRLMSPPVSGANATISQAWQEGQAFDYATTGSQVSDTVSNGFATQITGGSTVNGFDLSATNNSSIKYYSSGAWLSPSNTKSTSVKSQEGWMLFVRGDRKNFGQITNQYKTPTITTLRPRGGIFIGQKRFPASGTLTGKQVIGNPFASAFDFHLAYEATKAANGGTLPYADKYYMWDPNLGGALGVGAFVTYTWNGSSYDRTSAYSPINIDDSYIPSGAAFFVDFGATGGYLQIDESNKTNASTTKAYRPSANVRTNLLSVEPDGSTFISDGVLNLFNNNYNNEVDEEDATKLINIEGENFSTKRNGNLLSIEKRKLPQANDTIFYNWSKVKIREYQLQISTDSLQNSWLNIFLEDNYKKSTTPVSLTDTTRYNFKIVREDSGTFRADRFRLVMKYDPPVFSAINAYQQYSDIAVQWQVANEKSSTTYIIEKSSDGVNFSQVGVVKDLAASGSNIYQWIDTKAEIGNNFYRVHGVGGGGQTFYSSITRVVIDQPQIAVYPNPVTNGEVGIQLTNMPKGKYDVMLVNNLGQTVVKKEIMHLGGSESVKVPLATVKTRGIYQVQMIQPDMTKKTVKVIY